MKSCGCGSGDPAKPRWGGLKLVHSLFEVCLVCTTNFVVGSLADRESGTKKIRPTVQLSGVLDEHTTSEKLPKAHPLSAGYLSISSNSAERVRLLPVVSAPLAERS